MKGQKPILGQLSNEQQRKFKLFIPPKPRFSAESAKFYAFAQCIGLRNGKIRKASHI